LGVATEASATRDTSGAIVRHVVRGSPAEIGGVRASDRIVRMDGRVVGSPSELTARLADHHAGDEATLVVVRAGSEKELRVSLVAPQPEDAMYEPPSGDFDELIACVKPKSCPAGDEARVRQKAGKSFACPTDQVDAWQMSLELDGFGGSRQMFTGEGTASIIVQPKGAKAFEVHGCGHRGVVVCVQAHRTVHTGDASYQNTNDRLCLWVPVKA
jgi:hypothetical protein